MSPYGRIYICNFAPAAETWRDAIYNGAEAPDGGKLIREAFTPSAFIEPAKGIPVLLSHDTSKVVGHVTGRIVQRGWHIASFMLDASRSLSAVALDRLRVGTRVSIGFDPLDHDALLAQDDVMHHTAARMNELSILVPNEIPGYVGAKVTQILEPSKRSMATGISSDRGAEVFLGGGLIRRPGIGQVLGVR